MNKYYFIANLIEYWAYLTNKVYGMLKIMIQSLI